MQGDSSEMIFMIWLYFNENSIFFRFFFVMHVEACPITLYAEKLSIQHSFIGAKSRFPLTWSIVSKKSSYYQMRLCCIWSRNAENSSPLFYVVKT
jgi:hypothetical protein